VRRLSLLIVLCAAAAGACSELEKAKAGAKANADTVATLRTKMDAVEDTLGRMVSSLEASKAMLEQRVENATKLQETLAKNAPGVLGRLDAFVKEYRDMQLQLRAKDDTIRVLRERYASLLAAYSREKALNTKLQAALDSLRADTAARGRKIAALDSARASAVRSNNTAYQLIGLKSKLQDLKVIAKSARFGGKWVVAPDAPLNAFTAIDITKDREFTIVARARDVTLVSTHPASSYVIADEGGQTKLRILDDVAFWALTRRLVVSIDQ
jgi:predicted RNase H-like nuclease (RuvC/YqgF family)